MTVYKRLVFSGISWTSQGIWHPSSHACWVQVRVTWCQGSAYLHDNVLRGCRIPQDARFPMTMGPNEGQVRLIAGGIINN